VRRMGGTIDDAQTSPFGADDDWFSDVEVGAAASVISTISTKWSPFAIAAHPSRQHPCSQLT